MDGAGSITAVDVVSVDSERHLPEPHAKWRVERAFSGGARMWGGRPAIEIEGETISYRELERRSNRLARRLREASIGPGDIVALACADVGEFALGALAILKTGAAYLAIDMRYPVNRAREVLRQGAATLLLGGEQLPSALAPPKTPLLSDAFNEARLLGADPGPLDVVGTARDPAYLCATSGTSGRPKAAIVSHAGIRGLAAHPEFDGFDGAARVASCSTFAFDAVTFEVWGALLNGSCVVDVPRSIMRSPWELADFLSAARIDSTFLTTSLFNATVTRRPDAFGAMRCLVVGGEALDPAYVQRVFASGRAPARLLNGYGPTETTTFATCHTITPADVERGVIPIGRPIQGRRVHVLAADGRLAAAGEEGELCIGGPAVALGYLDEPALTADKFVADPFSGDPRERLYRTGDLCKTLPGGAIQYLGRLDDQVKVKGYRVEPAGVAARLRRVEGVDDALVLPRPGPFGTKELVAFLRGDEQLSASALRAAAARRMPDYMLPCAFHWVADFPLKDNGKVDAPALLARAEAGRAMPAAANENGGCDVEQKLFDIWRRNGRRTAFDLDTPYDEVGDSLSLVGLMIDIETAFGRRLSASDAPHPLTIRALTAALEAPEPARVRTPVRAFYISQPWNMQRAPAQIGAAIGAGERWAQLQIPPAAPACGLYDSIDVMAAHLEEQILEAGSTGPFRLAGHSFGGVLAFEVARRLEARGCSVARVFLLDSFIARPRPQIDRLAVDLKQALIMALGHRDRIWAILARRWRRSVGGEVLNAAEQIRNRCIQAMLRYSPSPIRASAVLFRCTRYEDVFERPQNHPLGRAHPWAALVQGALSVEDVGCTHSEIVQDEAYVAQVCRWIDADLAALP